MKCDLVLAIYIASAQIKLPTFLNIVEEKNSKLKWYTACYTYTKIKEHIYIYILISIL